MRPVPPVVAPFMKALSLRQLTKTYRNGVQALKGIDLDRKSTRLNSSHRQ